MTAAFLYCDGYRETISWMSSSFWAVNLNGMFELFSGVSRCLRYISRANGNTRGGTYHEERVAAGGSRDTEGPPLRPLELARGPGDAPEHKGNQFRGHCGFGRCAAGWGDGVDRRCQRWSSSDLLGITKSLANGRKAVSHLARAAPPRLRLCSYHFWSPRSSLTTE